MTLLAQPAMRYGKAHWPQSKLRRRGVRNGIEKFTSMSYVPPRTPVPLVPPLDWPRSCRGGPKYPDPPRLVHLVSNASDARKSRILQSCLGLLLLWILAARSAAPAEAQSPP